MLKITVINDNMVSISARRSFKAEHGLAFLLESADEKIMLDAGQSEVTLHNLNLLGIHAAELSSIIVSHGHYDHTGGLAALLQQAQKSMPVYIHPEAFSERYSVRTGRKNNVGIPYTKEYLVSLGAEFRYITKPFKLNDDLIISGPVRRTTDYETGDDSFMVSREGQFVQDGLIDDLAVYYHSRQKLLVISGCAHSGIINIIKQGFELTGAKQLYGIIGGTHLGPVSVVQQEETIKALQEFNPKLIAANHCTGFLLMAKLQHIFGSVFMPANVGYSLEVE